MEISKKKKQDKIIVIKPSKAGKEFINIINEFNKKIFKALSIPQDMILKNNNESARSLRRRM